MQRARSWVAACGAVLVSAISLGCDDNERPAKRACAHCGGTSSGGNAGGAGDAVNASGSGNAGAGGSAPAGGSSTLPNGGGSAATSSAGEPEGPGGDGPGAHAGSDGGGAAGAEGGGGTSGAGEQLQLCVRLPQGFVDADSVGRAYTTLVTKDCRVKWIMPVGQNLASFQNQVLNFSYDFWGCPQTPPVDSFGLVFGTPALSQGDANMLIDHYLTAAQDKLDLSPPERDTMEAALGRLSKPLIADTSLEPSKSICPVNGGGTGGAGSGGGGTSGAGGVAGNSTGGAP